MTAGGTSSSTSTVLTAWTGTLLRALEAREIDAAALARGAGITPEMLEDPDRRIPLHLSIALWRAAVEAVGDDGFGIEVSKSVRPGSFHALGQAFLASPTLRAGLERAARFSRVTSDVAVVSTSFEGSDLCFTIGWQEGAERPAWESVDAILSSLVRTARYLLDRSVSPTRLELERPPPHDVDRFRTFYGCPIAFDAPRTMIAFDRKVVERPVAGGNERIASVSEQAIDAHIAALAPPTVAEQVGQVLADAILAGEPDVRAVAAELAMSPRSLQRRLADEGTTFRDVLADTRRRLADVMLGSGRSVTATALRLGFSETAAFSRAYRRWTGHSPSRAGV